MTVPTLVKPWLDYVEKLIRIPNLELLDLSPDGQTAVVMSNETGSFQLATVPVDGGSLRVLTHGVDRVSWARVSNNSRDIAFSRDFGGKEQHQLFRIPLRGGMEQQIGNLPPTRVFDFEWSKRDDNIAFAGATQDFNGLWLLDTARGDVRNVYKGKHWVFGPDWSSDDSNICFSAKTTEAPTAFELAFVEGQGRGEPRIYTPKPGSENSTARWHPSEKRVLFKTDARGRYELAIYNPQSDELSYLKGGELGLGLDFPVYDWTPDGESVFYLASKEGRTNLYVESVEGSTLPVKVPLPEGYYAGFFQSTVKMTPEGKSIVFSWSSLSKPPTVSKHRLDSHSTQTLYEHQTDLPLGKAEKVVYKSFDGTPIHGWFLKPPGQAEPRPTILWIHGGPAWEVADEWNLAIQSFVVAGYPIFAPNIRGSTGYGVDFQNMNIHDIGGADLRDVEEAAKYLRTRSEVDPKKIAIVGASYGGYMTYLAMTKLPDLWGAGAAVVGITDWKEMYDLSDASFRSFIERYFGPPTGNEKLYQDRSPVNFINNIRAPLLIWHRGNDSRCPLQPVQKFADKLKQLGKKYEMEVVWDEGHGFQKTENIARQYKAIISFLAKELGTPQNY